MKRTRLRPVSREQQARKRKLNKLVLYLIQRRALGRCEICEEPPDFRGLQGAHIERRDRKGLNDTLENIIIACGRCHDHSRFGDGGLIIGKEKAREIVEVRNIAYRIKEDSMTKQEEIRGENEQYL